MANRARGNKVCAEPPSRPKVGGPLDVKRASKDEKDKLRRRFEGKSLLKALMAEKKRERSFT